MTEIENQILGALTTLAEAVKALPAADPKPDLRPLLARIDELTRRLPPSTDPTLLHYLHKKSYEKARRHLEGSNAENRVGDCRHG